MNGNPTPAAASAASDLGSLAQPTAAEYLRPCQTFEYSPADLRAFLRSMLLVRRVEEQIGSWVERGLARCPCHLGIGQEAVAVGIARSLRPGDRLFGNHRSHAHYLAAGGDVFELLAEVLGRDAGCSRGMGGSMHLRSVRTGFYGSVPIVGATIPLAVGAALAAKMDGGDDIAVAYFGDGACEEGVLHESLNLARVYQLPVLFVCENNLYSSHLDISLRQPSDSVARFARAHRMTATVLDGNDVTVVARAVAALTAAMRSDRLPVFVEAVTYRWRGHVGPKEDIDVGIRRSVAELNAWKGRDPVARLERALAGTPAECAELLATIDAEVRTEVESAAARALAAPMPTAGALLSRVYAGSEL
jgi:acetoin:2,6-dichlorophenolindophenol oxidoreductase subunit alpha